VTRTKPAEQRRAELLAAGQALFLAKGIAGTSLDDITQRAGVSKGLFYLYFASKEDLVLALREQFSHDLAERMRAAAAAVPASTRAGWADRLDACARAGLERYRELHDLHEVLFHHARMASPGSGKPDSERPGSGKPGSGKSGSVLSGSGQYGPSEVIPGQPDPAPAPAARVIRELFEAGASAGAFDVPDPESTAVLCYASMHAFDHDFRGRPGPDDSRLIRAAQQLFRRAAGLP
jgi:TetR/AcrR family transcriptional regulator, transcriptional repressor for nem operon